MFKMKSPTTSEDALTSLRPEISTTHRNNGAVGHSTTPTLDSFLSRLGDPGRYQIVVMILLATNCIPVVVNHLLMAFYAVGTPHNCRLPEEASIEDRSLFLPRKANASISRSHSYEECEMYLDPRNHSLGTQSCINGYEFHFEENEWNVVAEWGLVCNRTFVAPLITTTYFCGVMIGGVIFGSLSDNFGRKSMMLICLYTQCIIGIGIHFVRRLVVFIGLRFIQGIFIQGLQCVTYSMVMELFSPRYRTMAGCVVEGFWALGIVLLALIAKYVQHWRYIQLAINIPTIATIFYMWIIPESVRWLLSRGKVTRAEKIVRSIVSYNSLDVVPSEIRDEMEEVARNLVQQTPDKHSDLRDIITNRVIRRRSLVLWYIWLAVSLSYYGISYSIPNLSGDRYLNFIIGAGIELAAYILAFVVLNGFGRKYPLMVYLFLSGALSIAVVSVKHFVPGEWVDVASLATAFALVGKAAVVSCFCSIFIYSNELFPTVIRTVGVGCCLFWGRVGSLLAPQILLLGEHVYSESPQFVTFLTFGVLSLIASFLTLLLPETMNQDLPDTVHEAEMQSTLEPEVHYKPQPEASESPYAAVDDIGYGKSPEWVEVDGMIVSQDRDTLRTRGGGSTLSLPYSHRTLLTGTSCSDGTRSRSSGRSTAGQSENPYETIPADVPTSKSLPLHLRPDEDNPAFRVHPPAMLTVAQLHDRTQRPPLPLPDEDQDNSVISAHQSGIYGIAAPAHAASKEAASLEGYFRKNLLLADANETRL